VVSERVGMDDLGIGTGLGASGLDEDPSDGNGDGLDDENGLDELFDGRLLLLFLACFITRCE